MRNTGQRGAGSIAGAQFLQRFVKKGMPWAHIDIAGVAWQEKDRPLCVKGATAFGVRLLDRFVADNFEAQ
jgi:leucyl aminopeptidase